ncbi:hypothetical protein I350_03464 [Cryptococcus amylolentus CBS 6273]|uniref:EF-hand domain-containing protein n=1 Tax=Cryptococcus amylolentus CBS 6273 TaxID=1296118 RepID=A0A1E3K4W7_9TREE|nr:hypothetical protein I350_03464 [Cryptococcus amylolentus CBS 6273]
MSSRPRRAAASSSRYPADSGPAIEPEGDPEYLALSAKQRRLIDKTFNKGIRSTGAKSQKRKRRKVADGQGVSVGGAEEDVGGDQGGGGFFPEDDAGEFIPDDDAGGFLPDDNAGGFLPDDGAGGFMPDDDGRGGFFDEDLPDRGPSSIPVSQGPSSPSVSAARVPIYLLPSLLTSLGLPSDDDVLQVFRASASGWNDPRNSRRDQEDDGLETGGVELKDFRAVCAALMGPEEEAGESRDVEMDSDDSDEGQDTFQPSEAESDFSSASSFGSAFGGTTTATTQKGKGPAKPKRRGKMEVAKLSSNQKAMARTIWDMLKPPGKETGRGADILGRDEVKEWVRVLGEMWSDEEITDMVSLFSSQHEGRGLTFDDFGKIMLRAGLV